MAVPLVFAAWYISSFLYEKYDFYVQCLLIVLITLYLIFVMLSYVRTKTVSKLYTTVCVILGLALGTLVLTVLSNPKTLPEMTRLHSLSELADYRGKPLLITFSAQWCQNCHALDSEVYANGEFLSKKGSLSTVRFDLSDPKSKDNLEIAAYFGLVGVPQAILLDKDGHVIDRITGYSELNRFLKMLDKAKSSEKE